MNAPDKIFWIICVFSSSLAWIIRNLLYNGKEIACGGIVFIVAVLFFLE
jgi:hypothetical protein